MSHFITMFLIPAAAYLLGSVPFGLILCKAVKGVDIREHGSKNIGATNAGRVCGMPFFFITFALDFGKGLAPVLLGGGWAATLDGTPLDLLRVGYGVAAILGHTFPVYVGFKGGKAVATSFGVFVALAPWAALIALGVWGVLFLAFRYVSLASMVAAVAAPVAYAVEHWGTLGDRLPVLGFAAAIAVLVVLRHRANIARLLAGTESRVRFGKKTT
jgi:acyl phosphate:glycerol-3-phosphate acyltransferase